MRKHLVKREEFRLLARERIKDAEELLKVGRTTGCAYLCGYAVEFLLKARICRHLRQPHYPTNITGFVTHELETLLLLSGQQARVSTGSLKTHWSNVSFWDPQDRYDPNKTVSPAVAQRMILSAKELLRSL